MRATTRFAPSPTGFLHLGHLWSATQVARYADAHDARMLLRIEDIDHTRCKYRFDSAIIEDLAWMGFDYPAPVRRQSAHLSLYSDAAEGLKARGLLYPCFCTRREINARTAREWDDAGGAPHGPLGVVYDGRCRSISQAERNRKLNAGEPHSWRLDLTRALQEATPGDSWDDQTFGRQTTDWASIGDVLLVRRDIATSYHLSAVVDDGVQNITHIVRGRDLMHATPIHLLLQNLLGLPHPTYAHHSLLLDADGRTLSKRRGARALRDWRDEGMSPESLLALMHSLPKD